MVKLENKIENKSNVTVKKKDDVGVSHTEKREMKKRQNLGRGTNKMSAKGKIKGEMDKNLKRLIYVLTLPFFRKRTDSGVTSTSSSSSINSRACSRVCLI